MSSDSKSTADELARARKLLAKPKSTVFHPHTCVNAKLGPQNPQIGEHATLCLASPIGAVQYTFCRPIGFTDLPEDSWTMIQTDHVPGALARAKDPRQAELDKIRAAHRSQVLVDNELLIQIESEGQKVFYYPCDDKTPRNLHLAHANQMKKARVKEIKGKQKLLTKKSKPIEVQALASELQQVGDTINYLDDQCRAAEKKIRKYLSQPSVAKAIYDSAPNTHQTLIGPFGDQKQSAIKNSQGKTLVDLMGGFHKQLLETFLQTE